MNDHSLCFGRAGHQFYVRAVLAVPALQALRRTRQQDHVVCAASVYAKITPYA